jgi:hypothetical protein
MTGKDPEGRVSGLVKVLSRHIRKDWEKARYNCHVMSFEILNYPPTTSPESYRHTSLLRETISILVAGSWIRRHELLNYLRTVCIYETHRFITVIKRTCLHSLSRNSVSYFLHMNCNTILPVTRLRAGRPRNQRLGFQTVYGPHPVTSIWWERGDEATGKRRLFPR